MADQGPRQAEGTGVPALLERVDALLHEGNVRRIVVCGRSGRKVLDLPVTAGVVAAVFAPVLMAAGAALALAGGWTIQVEHTEPDVVDAQVEESDR